MLQDMDPADVKGEYREYTLELYGVGPRKVLVTDEEVPYPDGRLIVSRTDTDGIITHVNRSFVVMSGYEEEELIGAPHSILRHPDMPKAAFRDLWATVQRGDIWQGYVKNLRKDGAYYWVKATVIPNIRGGQVVGYTSVRRKPDRRKVEECIDLYARMRQEEAAT
ncbi:methyl-accepting chemotaxis protein [Methylomarinovum tepidoasis]|uniref:Methyl-accepting chemotaxis protein n=1 Tax=Methylomarinovum tepidoasis TaxID=2840183 RepID=A0AAU9C0M3_9GAMM|nr:PAS domain-containing protein [Methylomarinovum sp. IN45]BCX89458.1 methyl-accepting chemotaxis protein [Methylomarinovum sp. IN45]